MCYLARGGVCGELPMCIINILCLLTLLRMCSRCVELCPREIVEREYNPSLIIAHPALAAVPIAIAGSNEPRNLQCIRW